jgi:hypothetical protein
MKVAKTQWERHRLLKALAKKRGVKLPRAGCHEVWPECARRLMVDRLGVD